MIVNEILNEVRKRFSRAVICKKIGISTSALNSYLHGNAVKSPVTYKSIIDFCNANKDAPVDVKLCAKRHKRAKNLTSVLEN